VNHEPIRNIIPRSPEKRKHIFIIYIVNKGNVFTQEHYFYRKKIKYRQEVKLS